MLPLELSRRSLDKPHLLLLLVGDVEVELFGVAAQPRERVDVPVLFLHPGSLRHVEICVAGINCLFHRLKEDFYSISVQNLDFNRVEELLELSHHACLGPIPLEPVLLPEAPTDAAGRICPKLLLAILSRFLV